jgi:hypothetical protein
MSPDRILRALKRRGCILNPGASERELNLLSEKVGASIDPYVKELFMEFNGLKLCDEKSWLRTWSIQEVMTSLDEKFQKSGYLPFADKELYAEVYEFCPTNINSPVIHVDSSYSVANSFCDFWKNFINGNYDMN